MLADVSFFQLCFITFTELLTTAVVVAICVAASWIFLEPSLIFFHICAWEYMESNSMASANSNNIRKPDIDIFLVIVVIFKTDTIKAVQMILCYFNRKGTKKL